MGRWIQKILILILTFISISLSYGVERRALLVGINDYKNLPFFSKEKNTTIEDLKGPVNDAQRIKEILISYGWKEKEIKILTDREASRDGIISAFKEWLIEGTKEGDICFFYFSGHGTQIEDQNFDEDDGLDEALCAWDVKPQGARSVIEANLIIDDEWGVMFRKLSGRDVVAIVDACHSATVTTRSTEKISSYKMRFIPVRIEGARRGARAFSLNIPKQNDIPDGQIFFFSSKENERSFEFAYPDGFHGVFTFNLIEVLKRKKDITYRQAYEQVKSMIHEKDREGTILVQNPQIEPEKGKILDNIVFKPFVSWIPTESKPPKPVQPLKPRPPQEQKPKPPQKPQPIMPEPPPEIRGEKLIVKLEPIQGADLITSNLRNWLESLPHVELTEEEFFDRLIRGEKRDDQYRVRILNRIGDAVGIPPTSSLPELKESIGKQLDYAYLVKKLACITNPDPEFKVKVWVTDEKRQDFKIGEKIFFNFYSEMDCYLILLNLDSKGNFHIIFPNKYHRENFIIGGQTKTIPDKVMGFELEFGEPVGEEVIKAIATSRPLRLEEIGIERFDTLFDSTGNISVPVYTRAILVKKVHKNLSTGRFDWSEDTIVIRSHK